MHPLSRCAMPFYYGYSPTKAGWLMGVPRLGLFTIPIKPGEKKRAIISLSLSVFWVQPMWFKSFIQANCKLNDILPCYICASIYSICLFGCVCVFITHQWRFSGDSCNGSLTCNGVKQLLIAMSLWYKSFTAATYMPLQ